MICTFLTLMLPWTRLNTKLSKIKGGINVLYLLNGKRF